jgi:GNAT superfamily N-acetyltransferase
MSEIKKFINSKQFNFHIVKEEDYFDFIIEHDVLLEGQLLSPQFRDHVFITENDKIVGYTALMKDYEFPHSSTDDVMSMATIFIHSDYRNRGLSKPLIENSLNHIKDNDKILLRTKPSNDGVSYSFDRITKISNDLNLKFIPHNLDFVFQQLNNSNLFKNKDIDTKLKTFNNVCNELLLKHKLNDINNLDFSDHSYSLKSIINKKYKNLKI